MTVQDTQVTQATDFAAEWERWHKQHEGRLAAPDGFLAITSINWLSESPARFSDCPGRVGGRRLGCLGPARRRRGAATRRRGDQGQAPLRPDTRARWSVPRARQRRVRGGQARRATTSCAPRHPDNGLRTAFRGTPAYAPDPRWVIRGHYRPFETPRDTTVGSVVEGLQHVYAAPGAVEFEVDGQPLALTAFNGHAAGSLHILFTDATSGVTTYAAKPVAAGRRAGRGRHRGSLTSTGRPTCRAPTPSSPPARCPRQRTASRSRSTRASKTPTRPASRPDRSPVCR